MQTSADDGPACGMGKARAAEGAETTSIRKETENLSER